MAKKWYKIHSPKIFNSVDLGQTLSEDGKNLIGRTITVPLSRLIDDRGKQHISVNLRVSNLKESVAETAFVSYKLSRAYLSRYVRRRTSRIDSVDDVVTKDGKKLRIKSLLITTFKATRKQRYSLRKELSKFVSSNLKEYTVDSFLLSVTVRKFQGKIKKKMNKIYPVRYAEIRVIELK